MRKGNSHSAKAASTRFFNGLGNGKGTSQRSIHKRQAPGAGGKANYVVKKNAYYLVENNSSFFIEQKLVAWRIIDVLRKNPSTCREDLIVKLSRDAKLKPLKMPYKLKNGKIYFRDFASGTILHTLDKLRKLDIVSTK